MIKPVSNDGVAALSAAADGVDVRVKVVPGASRSKIVGLLGDRLKVMVAAPAEGGRANQAVRELLADAFGVPASNAVVSAGPAQPRKTITLIGLSLCAASERIKELLEATS